MPEETWILKVSVPANAPAGTIVPVDIQTDPNTGTTKAFTVPQDTMVIVKDLFVKAGEVGVDGILTLRRNEYQDVLKTDPVSALDVTNPAKPRYKEVVFGPGDRITALYTTLAATGTGGASVTIYMKVERVPAAPAGPAPAAPARPSLVEKIKAIFGR